jgi:hypothetical protein
MTAASAPWLPRTYVEQSLALSINPEEGKILTVDTCPEGSRTRRRASRRQAVQRAAGSSGLDSSPVGSTSALGTDCVARSTWAYIAKSRCRSVNQSPWLLVHVSRKAAHSLLGVLRLWQVRVPSIEQLVYLVQVRHAVCRCSRRKQHEYMRKSASPHIPFHKTLDLWRRAHLSASRSRREPRDPTISSAPHCAVASAAAVVAVVAVVAVATRTVDAAYLA